MPDYRNAIIADDDDFFRLALSSILKERHDIQFVCEAADFEAATGILNRENERSICFFDLDMPGMDSIKRLLQIRHDYPLAKVVVISSSNDRTIILSALEAGVHGYILKQAGPLEVSRAVGILLSGDIYVPASLANLAPAPALSPPSRPDVVSLTPRQREVLGLIMVGASNRDIAIQLGLGEGTVKVHVAGLLRALNVTKRSEVARIGSHLAER